MDEIVVPNTLRDRLESLVGRRRDMWIAAAVVAVVVFGALAVRGNSAPAIAPPPPAVPEPGNGSAPPSVLVHVAGAVVRPGVYEMPPGSRVADAIDAARGPRRNADLDGVNLADPLVDGTQILVPTAGTDRPAAPAPSSAPAAPAIDLNQADQLALESIPGVGPVTATAILQHRSEIGRFDALEDLLEVDGIGPATLESIRPYVTL